MTSHAAALQHISFAPTARQKPDSDARGWFADILKLAQGACGDPTELIATLKAQATPLPVLSPTTVNDIWSGLASVAAYDLTIARAVEPHLDAAAILHQAGHAWTPHSFWGVYAAESGSTPLQANQVSDAGTGWELNGPKPWCSLADQVTHAIVSAHTDDGRRTFTVDMQDQHVQVDSSPWPSNGLANIASGGVQFTGAPAHPVGATNWYLERPGFALGGVGVAAIWFGGAVGIFRSLQQAAHRRKPDQLALAWLGEADRLLHTGAAILARAVAEVEKADQDDFSDLNFNWPTALRIRGAIAEICERIITISAHALGPGPLTVDADHLRRVADLSVYIRQHHAARDDAAVGRFVLEGKLPSW